MTLRHEAREPARSTATPERDARRAHRLEIAAGVAVAIVVMAMTAWTAKDMWFYADVWDALTTRTLTSPESLLRPHAGHLGLPSAILIRSLYEVFGMDYWPWWYIPRLLAYSAMAFFIWRVLRWRGADPVVAFVFYVVVLVFGSSGWMQSAYLGSMVAYSLILGVAWLAYSKPEPDRRARVIMFLLLTAAVASSGGGVSGMGGTGLALLLAGRLRSWWPSLAGASAIYAGWYLSYDLFGRSTRAGGLDSLRDLPAAMLTLFEASVTRLFGTPASLETILVAVLVLAVAWLIYRRRLGIFEGILASAGLVWLLIVVYVRILPGTAGPAPIRYTYLFTLFLIPALVPHIRIPKRPALMGRVPVAYGLVVVLAFGMVLHNWDSLRFSLNWWEHRSSSSRQVVEAAALLLAAGEPSLRAAPIDFRSGPLSAPGVQRLLDEGWAPDPPDDPEAFIEARANLRMRVRPAGRIRGSPPTTDVPADEDGCVRATSAAPVTAQVNGASVIRVDLPDSRRVMATWTDEWGQGVHVFRFRDRSVFVQLMNPPSPATISIEPNPGHEAVVCGLANP